MVIFNSTIFINKNLWYCIFKKGKIKAIRHVISPEISMSFSPDFTKSKFGYYENVQINNEGDTKLLSKYENFLFGAPRIGSSAS